MIRISIEAKSTHTVVAIDGYVDQADLRQIERVRKELSGEVHLNLLGLEGSAPGGIQLLRAWLNAGARLDAATPYLVLALGDSTPQTPTHSKPDSTKPR